MTKKKTPAKKKAATWWVARNSLGYMVTSRRPHLDGDGYWYPVMRERLADWVCSAAWKRLGGPTLKPGAGPVRVRIRIAVCDEKGGER